MAKGTRAYQPGLAGAGFLAAREPALFILGRVKAMRVRELDWEERVRWGPCPVCEVPDGAECDKSDGLLYGRGIDGVHLRRLDLAPRRVRIVSA